MRSCNHAELSNNCWECACDSLRVENAALKARLEQTERREREAIADCMRLRAEKEQWEPEWKSQAEANAAGYNQAHVEISSIRSRMEALEKALDRLCSCRDKHDDGFDYDCTACYARSIAAS
jgi:chromosome segregation ATPase